MGKNRQKYKNIWNPKIFGINNLLEVFDRKYTLWSIWSYYLQQNHTWSWFKCAIILIIIFFITLIYISFYKIIIYFLVQNIFQKYQTKMVSIFSINSILSMTHHVILFMTNHIILYMTNHRNINNMRTNLHSLTEGWAVAKDSTESWVQNVAAKCFGWDVLTLR